MSRRGLFGLGILDIGPLGSRLGGCTTCEKKDYEHLKDAIEDIRKAKASTMCGSCKDELSGLEREAEKLRFVWEKADEV
ncbi:MAG: hypothetical protein ABIC57_00150 [bacterium]